MFPDIATTMSHLAADRPIFHSEDDFKFALAWYLKGQQPDAQVRLETPFDLPQIRGRLDLRYKDADGLVVVELKYKTLKSDFTVAEEDFHLKQHGAQDLGRYDYCRDVWRVESLVRAGHADRGLAILLTNDSAYSSRATPGTGNEAFSLHNKKTLEGLLTWPTGLSYGTTKGREAPIELVGSYSVTWHQFNRVPDAKYGDFKYCVLEARPSA